MHVHVCYNKYISYGAFLDNCQRCMHYFEVMLFSHTKALNWHTCIGLNVQYIRLHLTNYATLSSTSVHVFLSQFQTDRLKG